MAREKAWRARVEALRTGACDADADADAGRARDEAAPRGQAQTGNRALQQQQQQFAAATDLLSWPRSAAANFTQQLPAHPY